MGITGSSSRNDRREADVKLHTLLDEGLVLAPLKGRSRDDVLREMVERLLDRTGAAPGEDILGKLLERERLGTTAIGGGVAVPHCRVGGLKAPLLVLGVSREGVAFESVDGRSSHVVFLIVSPLEHPNVNLRILASIAKLVRKSGTLASKLLTAPTAGETIRVLREEEDRGHG
jgi:PTS system nitrogen regulatory IIA component